jgi:hypothetical protein
VIRNQDTYPVRWMGRQAIVTLPEQIVAQITMLFPNQRMASCRHQARGPATAPG